MCELFHACALDQRGLSCLTFFSEFQYIISFYVINCVIVVLSCTVLWNVKNYWKLHVNYSKLILSFLKFAPLAQHLQDVYVFLKCTRSHHITYEKSKISRGWYPRTPFNSSGLRPSHSGFARKKSTFVKPATPVTICFLRHWKHLYQFTEQLECLR